MKIDFIKGCNRAIALEDETCDLSKYGLEGTETIFGGFTWNGASISHLLMTPLFLSPWHHTVRRASKWHDYAYTCGWNRKKSDRMFMLMCIEDGMNIVQAKACFYGLYLGGWKAYKDCQK